MANSGRSRVGEDRFYSPPAMRRYNQQQQQVQHEEQKVQQEKQDQSESLMSSRSSGVTTNLDRFMKHTTPIVNAQHFPKTSMKKWRNHGNDYHPYFVLGDLWESLKEWSAYGAGVPLLLNESDSVIQYYVPYLSAIQLYVDPSSPITSIRRHGEESDSESSKATSSDGSFGADETEIRNPPGLLIFEYFERASPFHRAPLTDKISLLASQFPALKTYRSCDLTQSSWVSVAWYPIYRIPVGPSLQNVDTSFLTFHSLSTPLRSTDEDRLHLHDTGLPCRLSLPIFGLAVYKFKSSDWSQTGVHGTEKVNSLIHSTENWLHNLNVNHPDFMFFKNHDFWR